MKKREMEKKLRLAEDALENVEFLAAQSGNCSAQRLIDKIDGVIDDHKRAVRQVEAGEVTK